MRAMQCWMFATVVGALAGCAFPKVVDVSARADASSD
jgi:hypothetical protein